MNDKVPPEIASRVHPDGTFSLDTDLAAPERRFPQRAWHSTSTSHVGSRRARRAGHRDRLRRAGTRLPGKELRRIAARDRVVPARCRSVITSARGRHLGRDLCAPCQSDKISGNRLAFRRPALLSVSDGSGAAAPGGTRRPR